MLYQGELLGLEYLGTMEDGHKAFLQWMMVERVVSEEDLKKAIGTIRNIRNSPSWELEL